MACDANQVEVFGERSDMKLAKGRVLCLVSICHRLYQKKLWSYTSRLNLNTTTSTALSSLCRNWQMIPIPPKITANFFLRHLITTPELKTEYFSTAANRRNNNLSLFDRTFPQKDNLQSLLHVDLRSLACVCMTRTEALISSFD